MGSRARRLNGRFATSATRTKTSTGSSPFRCPGKAAKPGQREIPLPVRCRPSRGFSYRPSAERTIDDLDRKFFRMMMQGDAQLIAREEVRTKLVGRNTQNMNRRPPFGRNRRQDALGGGDGRGRWTLAGMGGGSI